MPLLRRLLSLPILNKHKENIFDIFDSLLYSIYINISMYNILFKYIMLMVCNKDFYDSTHKDNNHNRDIKLIVIL